MLAKTKITLYFNIKVQSHSPQPIASLHPQWVIVAISSLLGQYRIATDLNVSYNQSYMRPRGTSECYHLYMKPLPSVCGELCVQVSSEWAPRHNFMCKHQHSCYSDSSSRVTQPSGHIPLKQVSDRPTVKPDTRLYVQLNPHTDNISLGDQTSSNMTKICD